MLKFVDDAKLKFGVWNRERKERAEARKAEHQDPANVTIPLSLVRSAKLAAWMAYFSLVYFLWLYTLDIARDRAASLHLTHVGGWIGDVQFYFPYIVGFAVVAVGIPYVAKIAIPTFMSLSWRGNFWPKLWALIIATAVSLVVIAGTFTVQGDTIMERDRDAAVAVEGVQQSRAALEAQIESRRQELADMMNNSNAYLAQAASVGAAEWERSYIAQARATNDPRLPMIERAIGAARSADTARAEINTLRQQLAQSQTVASVQGEVVTERTGWIADTLGWLEGVRAILLSLVMDIVCLIMPWIALRLEQARNRQMGVESSGWAPKGLRIEDLRDEEPIAKGTATMQTVMEEEDLATGEKKRMIKPKPYWRTVKKGKKQRIEVPPEMVEDENGVYTDGGNRTATAGVTLGGRIELAAASEDHLPDLNDAPDRGEENGASARADDGDGSNPDDPLKEDVQTEPPIDFEELAAQVAEESVEGLPQEHIALNDEANGGDTHSDVTPEALTGGDLVATDIGAADEGEQSEQLPEEHQDLQPEQREDRMLAPPSVIAAE